MYQLAYKKMIGNNNWDKLNAFLMPELREEENLEEGTIGYRIGEIRNPIFDELGIQPIQ